MIEREICETYNYTPSDFDENGRRKSDGMTFRNLIKDFERVFHNHHSAEYALNLYANSQTMNLLARSCDAAPFLLYGMELTEGKSFDAEKDPYRNHQMDQHSQHIYVYGIDSAYMTEFEENGYPILDDDKGIYPLTLLIDDTMREDEVRLSVPTMDDGDETEDVTINVPQFEYA